MIAGFTIESTIFPYIAVWGIKPNLAIVMVISIAMLKGSTAGALSGFFIGMIRDVFFGKFLGLHALLSMYMGFAAGHVNTRLVKENFLVLVFLSFFATTVYESTYYFLYSISRYQPDIVYFLKRIILPESIYNAVIAVFVYLIFHKLEMGIQARERATRKY